MFTDRVDAGRQLAEELRAYADAPATIVLGIPRGGVVVAAEVASALHLPLDIVLAAKVGAPGNPEYAIGAVTADGQLVANPDTGFDTAGLEHAAGPAREKIVRQLRALRGDRPPLVVAGLTTIVVDDGLATGLTALAALRYLRRQGAARTVLAVPVSAESSARRMRGEVDEFVAVDVPAGFSAVGQFYARFGQTEDWEVRALLADRDNGFGGR
jgi:putative phosphoribosyl transferase